jgi:hypothetical protein
MHKRHNLWSVPWRPTKAAGVERAQKWMSIYPGPMLLIYWCYYNPSILVPCFRSAGVTNSIFTPICCENLPLWLALPHFPVKYSSPKFWITYDIRYTYKWRAGHQRFGPILLNFIPPFCRWTELNFHFYLKSSFLSTFYLFISQCGFFSSPYS